MPQLRKDPIVGRWVIIATERSQRPSDFAIAHEHKRGGYCPFCAGSEADTPREVLAYRPDGGEAKASDWRLRVVPNKFPALMVEGDLDREGDGVYDLMNGVGAHEVVIETPLHDATIPDLSQEQVTDVLWAYRDRMIDLKRDIRFRYVMVFKNQGASAGASLEHSHSQLIALPIVPRNVDDEMRGSREYFDFKERCIYCDIVRQEMQDGTRVVYQNEQFLVICPFAPKFAFECWILPKQHRAAYEETPREVMLGLADALKTTLAKLAVALDEPPYNYMLHTLPFNEDNPRFYHWHIELIPKLTKVAGFEWGSGFYINPTPPEEAAAHLRDIRV